MAKSSKSAEQLEAEFNVFFSENLELWQAIKKRARDYAKALPTGPLSISLIIESLRYEYVIRTKTRDGFKINNNHRAFYARLLNKRTKQSYAGRFKVRTSSADSIE